MLRVVGRAGVRAILELTFDGTRYGLGDAPLSLSQRILRKLEDGAASASELTEMLHKRKGDVLDEVRRLKSEGYASENRGRVDITVSGRWLLRNGTPEPAGNR